MADPVALDVQGSALFLDFDGTLVELAERPELIVVQPRLRPLLQALQGRLDGALAIVSGRPLAQIDAYLLPLRFAGAGLHGAELRLAPDAATSAPRPLGDIGSRLQARFRAVEGILVEDKGAGVAVHYRQAPERGPEVETAMREIAAADHGGCDIELVAGKRVYELRLRGVDKGAAVRSLMALPPFSGRRPIFIGDDVTDEDGIVAALSLGGTGYKVGQGASAALDRFASVDAVHAWLEAALATPHRQPADE